MRYTNNTWNGCGVQTRVGEQNRSKSCAGPALQERQEGAAGGAVWAALHPAIPQLSKEEWEKGNTFSKWGV